MKLTLSQSSYELRDAGEVAFGILAMAILVAVGAVLLVAVLSVLWARPLPLLPTSAVVWAGGMLLVLRHYRRATRAWTTERRGGDMLFLVECIVASASFAASVLLGASADGLVQAIRFSLGGFLLLLVFSHGVTYALLRYRPRLKEVAAWTAIAVAVVIELARNG
jgi:hypothetical protein